MKHEAGRELDVEVAEKVMGWKEVSLIDGGVPGTRMMGRPPLEPTHIYGVPYYSTEITDAWEIVEKLKKKNYTFKLEENSSGWVARFYLTQYIQGNNHTIQAARANSDSAPLAISLAALKAVSND